MQTFQRKPKILISNDDGMHAKGIEALIKVLRPLGDVTVAVPDGPRSGASASITSAQPIFPTKMIQEEGYAYYRIPGTPADCVKLALNLFYKEHKPDLVVTGINHGRNDAICVVYSGTIGAAMEACIAGVPALAVSLNDHDEFADMQYAEKLAFDIARHMLQTPPPPYTMLSLNVPKGAPKGLKVCPQAITHFVEEYTATSNGRGKTVYWMTGYMEKSVSATDTDFDFLNDGFATLTPLMLDLTNYQYLDTLKKEVEPIAKENNPL